MDFDDTLEEAAFRAEVCAWLTENVEPHPRGQVIDLEARFEQPQQRFLAT